MYESVFVQMYVYLVEKYYLQFLFKIHGRGPYQLRQTYKLYAF